MSEVTMIYDKKLTEHAKSVFGDIVKKAYVTFVYYPNYGDNPDSIMQGELSIIDFLESDKLRYNTTNIVIEFTNGKKVKFFSSGWATLQRV